jgi:hypothetical protein
MEARDLPDQVNLRGTRYFGLGKIDNYRSVKLAPVAA